jgi:hypothetical protein
MMFENPLGDLFSRFRIELVIGNHHLCGQAAQLVAGQLHREVEAVANVDADRRARPRQSRDEADFHLVLRLRGKRQRTGKS